MKQECKFLKNYLCFQTSNDQIRVGRVVIIVKFHFANQAYVGPNGTLRAQNKRMSITLYYIRIQRRCSQYYKAEEKNFVKF